MPAPVLTLVHYQARPGCEEELAGVLRTHVARLREFGLASDLPSFVAARTDRAGAFVESFWWLDQGSEALARDHGELQEMWMRVEDLCVEGGVQHVPLEPLA